VAFLLVAGAAGALIYSLAPTAAAPPAPTARRRAATSPVKFTPHGPETPIDLPPGAPGGGAITLRSRKPKS
jgi:hypothetical protein